MQRNPVGWNVCKRSKILSGICHEPRPRLTSKPGFCILAGCLLSFPCNQIIPLMKKTIWGLLITLSISGCASIFPPKATEYQNTDVFEI